MSIDRQHGNISFSCDSCNDSIGTELSDFVDAWNFAKREGWKAQKIGKDWVHACPHCEVDR